MGGETEAEVSGWTVDTLHAYLQRLMNERDTRYEQRFIAQEKASEAAIASAAEAVKKAEAAQEKRNEAANEFRGQLADQAATLMPRKEATVLFDAVNEKIISLNNLVGGLGLSIERINAQQAGATSERDDSRARSVSIQALIGTVIGVVVFVVIVAGFVVGLTQSQ